MFELEKLGPNASEYIQGLTEDQIADLRRDTETLDEEAFMEKYEIKLVEFKAPDSGEIADPVDVKSKAPGKAAKKTKSNILSDLVGTISKMKKEDLAKLQSKLTEEKDEEDDMEDGEEDDGEMKDDEKEMDEKKKCKKESKKVTKEDLDTSDFTQILTEEESFSDEFKEKVTTIFEASIVDVINTKLAEIEEEKQAEIEQNKVEVLEQVQETVDEYLEYIVEQWLKDNELAIERGIKAELVEDFMSGLKELFTEHYIDIPEEKIEVVEEIADKLEETETTLNEEIETNIQLRKELEELKKDRVFSEVSEGLADTEKAKLQSLSEGLDFENETEFKEKLVGLKETYFKKDKKSANLNEDVNGLEEEVGDKKVSSDPVVQHISDFLGKHAKK